MPRPVPTALAALMVRNGVDALRAFPTVLRTVGTLGASPPVKPGHDDRGQDRGEPAGGWGGGAVRFWIATLAPLRGALAMTWMGRGLFMNRKYSFMPVCPSNGYKQAGLSPTHRNMPGAPGLRSRP
jgi:hypothetical protein